MKIKKYVHATISLEIGGKVLLFDPGKYNFGGGRFDLDYLKEDHFDKVDLLLLTHTHADHYFPEAVEKIISMCQPIIISNSEVGGELSKKSVEHFELKAGEEITLDGITIKAITCDHVVDGIGYLVKKGENSVYFVGDSLYQAPEISSVDVLFVPIGNRGLVMGPEEAAKFTSKVNPKFVIPVHYESPKDTVFPYEFQEAMKKVDCNSIVKVMQYQEILDLAGKLN